MTKKLEERKFENLILGDPAKVHDLVDYDYDVEQFEFTLTICQSGNFAATKKFKFKNVDEFQFEIIDAESLEQQELLRPIIGIDNYTEIDGRQKVVINCSDVEFIFKTENEPERID